MIYIVAQETTDLGNETTLRTEIPEGFQPAVQIARKFSPAMVCCQVRSGNVAFHRSPKYLSANAVNPRPFIGVEENSPKTHPLSVA
jgi:hypothetical protein